MKIVRKSIILSVALATSLFASAGIVQINDERVTDLVVTNNNMALTTEEFSFVAPKGTQAYLLKYEGMPKSMVGSSLIYEFNNIDRRIGSPFVHYYQINKNLFSYNKFLERNVGKRIDYKKTIADGGYVKTAGTILSINPIVVKELGDSENIHLVDPKNISFKKVPLDLSVKPSIVWKMDGSIGSNQATMRYLSKNINWQAHHNIILNEEEDGIKINSTLSVTNNSGKEYKNVKLKCLAGEINTVSVPRLRGMNQGLSADKVMSTEMAVSAPETISGYKLYKIKQRITLKDNQTTEIPFIEKELPAKIELNYQGYFDHMRNSSRQDIQFNQVLVVSEKSLYFDIPAGILRLYNKDKEGKLIFVGENRIKNAAKGTLLEIPYGKSFDIKGKMEVLSYESFEELVSVNKNRKNHYKYRIEGTVLVDLQNSGMKDKLVKFSLRSRNAIGEIATNIESKRNIEVVSKGGVVSYSVLIPSNSHIKFKTSFSYLR